MRPLICSVLLVIWVPSFAETSGPALSRLEQFSTGLEDLQLEFSQVVKSQDGRIKDQTQGKAWLQKPDKLRWVYSGDFPEIIVADGRNVWVYDQTLQQVTVKPQSSQIADAPLLMLTDPSQLTQQFRVAELGDFEDMQLLELKSYNAESEFERILVGLDPAGIRMMIMEDAFGQRTEIQFKNISRNSGLDAKLFSFTPPEGTDVVGEITSAE